MINSIIGGLIYIKVRRVMELFPPRLRTMWKDWELHAMVLLSLTLQMILIFFGNRRKYTNRIWIRIVLWCSYLMADWVATVALGVILDNLGNVVEGNGKDGSLNSDVELTAFWAPFLLLHLGGPDTITAYSLEDNELWLRHLLGLGVETGVALYIFLMAWTGSKLSILSILMLCAGIIKYGERTWALRSASNEEFRASMLTPADPGPNYAKFMQEYSLKQFEGFQVIAEEINEVHVPIDLSSVQNNSNHDKELLMAYNLLQIFKRLFVDLILGVDDRESSQSLFAETGMDKAFKLIEIELGFVYDMLYTKAPVVHSLEACILRLLSFACTCSVLVIFSLADHKHSSVDLFITYLLLCAAVVLEVYAVLLLFSSDWTDLWLCKRRSSSYITKFIACLQLPKPPRWSNSMAQFNALSFYLKDKTTICDGIQKLLRLSKVLEKYQYTKYKKVSCYLRELIFNHLKTKSEQLKSNGAALDVRPIISCRGSQVLNDYNVTELDWSVKVDFDQSILIWHIATYLCYKVDHPKTSEVPENDHSKLSKRLSQYMIYLLVMHPYMLPVGIGMIRFRDTQAEVVRFFEEYKSTSDNTLSQTHTSINLCVWAMEYLSTRKSRVDKFKACKMLLKVNTAVVPIKVKGDRSKSVLFEGCRLASQLQKALPDDRAKKWEMICNVWVEMLAYAASQCRGNYHAQQLRRGGELLSHVWLLMAHFGLTDQFQISQGHARVKLVVK